MTPVRFDVANAVGQTQSTKTVSQPKNSSNTSFQQLLNSEISGSQVKISAHAQQRLSERNVNINAADQTRLNSAVDNLARNGADKSLVLMDNLALVVSAKNRVVITALDSASAKDGVFTNIDSAVII